MKVEGTLGFNYTCLQILLWLVQVPQQTPSSVRTSWEEVRLPQTEENPDIPICVSLQIYFRR